MEGIKFIIEKKKNEITCQVSYAEFKMNMGVWIYGNRYCGKKHCHSITKCGQKKSAASSKIWIIMPKTYHEYFSYLCWIRLRRYTSLWQVLQYSRKEKPTLLVTGIILLLNIQLKDLIVLNRWRIGTQAPQFIL